MKIIPTILSGGAGTRLWPISRDTNPKPFIKTADGVSLLQHAFLRAVTLANVDQVLTITNHDLFCKTEEEYRRLDRKDIECTYLLEPMARDTAAATALASLYVQQVFGGDAIIILLPADHTIQNNVAFREAVAKAIDLTHQNRLVTFGITPEYAETGYGYIEADGLDVLRFVEKPDTMRAEEYIASGRFYWNSGMLCFSAQTMLEQLEKHSPTILETCRKSILCAKRSRVISGTTVEIDRELFAQVPKTSIDYAVLEKADNVAVVGCDIGWNDIGSLSALGGLFTPDASGNRSNRDTVLVETENCFIHSTTDRLIGTVGVKDLVIVESSDTILVAHKDSVQNVKQLFLQMNEKEHAEHSVNPTVQRPWGTYTVLQESERFKIKQIEVKPRASLSLQMHKHRSEHWVVVSGIAKVINDGKELILNTNESTYIPCGNKHRLENHGTMTLVIIEVQIGDYLGEDDIVRFEDGTPPV